MTRWIAPLALALSLLGIPADAFAQNASQPTNLVLEVHYYPKERPAYQAVPPSTSSAAGGWYARFERVPRWMPPAGFYPVHAVNIKSILAGDLVQIWISVFVGQKFDELEKTVAVRSLREGEKTTIQELTQFGVEPFDLALVRVGLAVNEVPKVASKAKSIELVTIQPNLSTLPSYRVALRNLSSKNVSALSIRVLQGPRTELSSMPQGHDGEPLILAGGVSEFIEPAPTRAASTGTGYQPTALPNLNIEVSTAVFDDGSFEGDIEPAIAFHSFVKGRKIQLGRVVALLAAALQDENADPLKTLDLLSNDVAALKVETEPSVVQEVSSEFPGLDKKSESQLRNEIEIALRGVRKDLLSEIQRFRTAKATLDSHAVHVWLVISKQRYETWLSHL